MTRSIPLDGVLPFRDAPISVFVDAEGVVVPVEGIDKAWRPGMPLRYDASQRTAILDTSKSLYTQRRGLATRLRNAQRDLVETEDGRIVIWNDDGDMVWLSPASDVLQGTLAYEPCIRCHDIIEEDGSPYAPSAAGRTRTMWSRWAMASS